MTEMDEVMILALTVRFMNNYKGTKIFEKREEVEMLLAKQAKKADENGFDRSWIYSKDWWLKKLEETKINFSKHIGG